MNAESRARVPGEGAGTTTGHRAERRGGGSTDSSPGREDKRWMDAVLDGWRRDTESGCRQWDPEQCQKLCKRHRGQANGVFCLASCSAAEPRGAEALLSPVIDGTVQEEINSQAFAGGELGGVSILKILNECARACGVAADTSLKPALPTLFLARFRHNLTASY